MTSAPHNLRIGTSGWQYEHWRGVLYGEHQPHDEWLRTYLQTFSTVEVNNTFYRLPEATVFERWRGAVPEGFTFAVKASRYLTHIKRLLEPEEPVERFISRAAKLGPTLGPVLVQLPPTLEADAGRLQHLLATFPATVRVAVEFRHSSWLVDEIADVLRLHGAPVVLTNRGGRWLEPVWDGPRIAPRWRTADWAYVRLHSGSDSSGGYSEAEIGDLCERLGAMADLPASYVYFNNDGGGHAVWDALSTARHMGIAIPDPVVAARQ